MDSGRCIIVSVLYFRVWNLNPLYQPDRREAFYFVGSHPMPSQVMQQKESQGHSWLMFALGIGIGVGVGLGVGVVMAATIPSAKVAAVTYKCPVPSHFYEIMSRYYPIKTGVSSASNKQLYVHTVYYLRDCLGVRTVNNLIA
ncbi:hypothetical protein EB796_015511 [Bugula neritina]|uniref:Uncharacterized protein n=1 Tax=Bugula neritina TaxID=10212 RepID=A0A7J7JLD5_BUGNE|nr:hypothetical protein EB796_015511 [Bugula neritina]